MIGVISALQDRFLALLTAPFTYPDMLWILIPLFLTLIFIELYFARYKFEELGWSSAFGNALVLLFVAIDSFRYLSAHGELVYLSPRNILIISLTLIGIVMSVTNFLHFWSKEFAYGISGSLPINFIAYMAILIIYSSIPLDIFTFIASFGILAFFVAIILLLRYTIPKAIELDEDEYLEREKAPRP